MNRSRKILLRRGSATAKSAGASMLRNVSLGGQLRRSYQPERSCFASSNTCSTLKLISRLLVSLKFGADCRKNHCKVRKPEFVRTHVIPEDMKENDLRPSRTPIDHPVIRIIGKIHSHFLRRGLVFRIRIHVPGAVQIDPLPSSRKYEVKCRHWHPHNGCLFANKQFWSYFI